MSRRKYANPGERVRVVTPKLFIRCGYTLTSDIIMDTREKEVTKAVNAAHAAMVQEIQGESVTTMLSIRTSPVVIDQRVRFLLNSAVCSMILENEQWGGKEKKIFEYDASGLQDSEVIVTKKYIVKTGFYHHASGGYCGYSGEWDYEPAYLDDAKVHCVYEIELDPNSVFYPSPPTSLYPIYPLKILAVNCKRLLVV